MQACILSLKMENTWDPWKNSCEALIAPDLTRPNIENSAWQMDTNGVSAMSLGTWVNPTGYLGVQGTQASYF